jgi:hypothetical protein
MAEMWNFVDEMWTDRLGRRKIAAERAEWPQRQRTCLTEDDPSTDVGVHRPVGTTNGDQP